MNSGPGGNGEPYEDPFADGDYSPSLAFAAMAVTQSHEHLGCAAGIYKRLVFEALDTGIDNPRSRAAQKSARTRLLGLTDRVDDVERAYERARMAAPDSPEAHEAIQATIDGFGLLRGAYERLEPVLNQILTPNPQWDPLKQAPLPILRPIDNASDEVGRRLRAWATQERANTTRTELSPCLLKTTPGTGKTEAQIVEALYAQQIGRRVLIATRTKEPITGESPELVNRVVRKSVTGRVSLAVVIGRNEHNCYFPDIVKKVADHGYSPGHAVCLRCERYPDNAAIFGLGICDYYAERIRAHNLSRAAKLGQSRVYPLIFTTHSTIPQIYGASGGGRYSAHWASDEVHIDEDPTEALRPEVRASEAQCDFISGGDPDTYQIEIFAQLIRTAMKKGREERSFSKGVNFAAPGNKAWDSHPIHTSHGSCYRGERLHELFKLAFREVAQRYPVGTLPQLLGDVIASQGFVIDPGSLSSVTEASDLSRMRIPPKQLYDIARALQLELIHSEDIERQQYRILDKQLLPRSADERRGVLDAHVPTGLEQKLPYVLRLDCTPASVLDDRPQDEWSLVLRKRETIRSNAMFIIGDAYAHPEHYRRLFGVDPHVISVMSELQPETRIVRLLDAGCGVGHLRRGGLQRVLAIIAAALIDARGDVEDVPGHLLPRMRVLLYGHKRFRPEVEAFMRNLARRLRIPREDWAVEHWWGGRGKDAYNGWECTICYSDPIMNVAGIEHVANAEWFWQAQREKDPEKRVMMERLEVGNLKHGIIHALRNSDALIQLEHERQNVAEYEQAIHRPRPARNAVSILTVGEMELGRELVTQTDTYLPRGYRSAISSRSRSKQNRRKNRTVLVEGRVSRFVSDEEVCKSIRGILDWFGVFSPWFAHALTTIPLTDLTHFDRLPGVVGSYDLIRPPQEFSARRQVPCDAVPDRAIAPTVIRRVWEPPVDWMAAAAKESWPESLRNADRWLKEVAPSFKPSRRANWQGGHSGRRAAIYWDPELCDGDVERAERYYFDIVDHQYGPVGMREIDGEQERGLVLDEPKPLPPSLRAWREDPKF